MSRCPLVIVAVLLLLFGQYAHATPPTCAVLFGGTGGNCSERFNRVWLQAAEDEAIRVLETLEGGFLPPSCQRNSRRLNALPQRVPAVPFPLQTLICIDPFELPCDCAFKNCKYLNHPELFEDDACDTDKHKSSDDDDDDDDDGKRKSTPKQHHKRSDIDKSACRKASSWLRIALEKLAGAFNATEHGDFESAASFSCVAELLFSRIAQRIDHLFDDDQLVFLNDAARDQQHYTFVNSTVRNATFTPTGSNSTITVQLRAIEVVRTCGDQVFDENNTAPITAVLLFSHFDGNATVKNTTQLVWAVAGTLPTFDITVAPVDPTNFCARQHVASNLDLFNETREFPGLTSQDYAVVVGDGATRVYLDLQEAATCPLIVLLENMRTNVTEDSLTLLQFRNGINALNSSAFSALFNNSIFLRVADGDNCTDIPANFGNNTRAGNGTSGNATALAHFGFLRPLSGVPVTMPPSVSLCVGGDRAGAVCNQESECGAGWACRRKPFAPRHIAFCYDGSDWDETRPCAFADADDQCPYGECVGEANGMDGGAYPFLYFYKSNGCDDAASAIAAVCSEPHVADWHAYPNENAFSL